MLRPVQPPGPASGHHVVTSPLNVYISLVAPAPALHSRVLSWLSYADREAIKILEHFKYFHE